jgi:hypothetical protein
MENVSAIELAPPDGQVPGHSQPPVTLLRHLGRGCSPILSLEDGCIYTSDGRLLLKCDGTRAETRFRLSAKRTSPFKSVGGVSSVDYWQPRCAHQR